MQLLLRILNPRFIRCDVGISDDDHGRPNSDGTIEWGGFPIDIISEVQSLQDADGVQFLCPKCFVENGGPVGTHRIAVYFAGRGAPLRIGLNSNGTPARWQVMGSDFLDLTLDPSVSLNGGCAWHGWVQHGVVRNAE